MDFKLIEEKVDAAQQLEKLIASLTAGTATVEVMDAGVSMFIIDNAPIITHLNTKLEALEGEVKALVA